MESYSYSLSPGLLFLRPVVTYLIIDLGKSSLFRLKAVRRHKMSRRYTVLTHEENVHMVTYREGGREGRENTQQTPVSHLEPRAQSINNRTPQTKQLIMAERAPRTVEALHSALTRLGGEKVGVWAQAHYTKHRSSLCLHRNKCFCICSCIISKGVGEQENGGGGQTHHCKLLILVSHK